MSDLVKRLTAYSTALASHGDERTMEAALVREAATRIERLEAFVTAMQAMRSTAEHLPDLCASQLDEALRELETK